MLFCNCVHHNKTFTACNRLRLLIGSYNKNSFSAAEAVQRFIVIYKQLQATKLRLQSSVTVSFVMEQNSVIKVTNFFQLQL